MFRIMKGCNTQVANANMIFHMISHPAYRNLILFLLCLNLMPPIDAIAAFPYCAWPGVPFLFHDTSKLGTRGFTAFFAKAEWGR